MSRFGIQLKQRHDMKHMTHIATLALSVLLALTACERNRHNPEEDKVPLSFSALSQTTSTKADGTTTPFPHTDFGVWGVARKNSNTHPYILWESDAMSPVIKNGTEYYPQGEAYWITDYKYRFIAIAPWEDWQGVAKAGFIAHAEGGEHIKFTYDMATKYENGPERDLDFDLMASVGNNEVTGPAGEHPSEQKMIFHHLFTKILITVNFEGVTGVVNEMRLLNVDNKAEYTISFSSDNSIGIGYVPVSDTAPALTSNEKELVITRADLDQNQQSQWTLHILPQDISDFELYMDFAIGDVETKNFVIDLSAAKSVKYERNQRYNWNIKINPKGIGFDVEVTPWGDPTEDEFDFE